MSDSQLKRWEGAGPDRADASPGPPISSHGKHGNSPISLPVEWVTTRKTRQDFILCSNVRVNHNRVTYISMLHTDHTATLPFPIKGPYSLSENLGFRYPRSSPFFSLPCYPCRTPHPNERPRFPSPAPSLSPSPGGPPARRARELFHVFLSPLSAATIPNCRVIRVKEQSTRQGGITF